MYVTLFQLSHLVLESARNLKKTVTPTITLASALLAAKVLDSKNVISNVTQVKIARKMKLAGMALVAMFAQLKKHVD